MIGKNNKSHLELKHKEDEKNTSNEYNQMENYNFGNSILKSSLDYYDNEQPRIQKIINDIDYIRIIKGNNINDTYVFYNDNDNEIFRSRIEHLAIFIPQNNTWKWSWAIPFANYKNTLISRKILEYAFTLGFENESELFLKSTLVNSQITISNQYQLDIYLALSAMLSKKPFILRYYVYPFDNNDNTTQKKSKKNIQNNEEIYYYRKILNLPDKKNVMSVFVFLIDWK